MVHCCLQTDGLGYQVFNAVNDDITIPETEGTSEDWLRKVCPETEILTRMGEKESPVSNKKMKDMLGFREEFGWRQVLGREG
jgi:hypothetical protein